MLKNLPTKLNKEPLLEALFEIRFESNISFISMILPGLLFNNLVGDKQIEQLSTAHIPDFIRLEDPNLKFAPISRVTWNNFYINIGEKVISIGCHAPYQGWENFKKAIIDVMDILKAQHIVHSVERYSVKYVNIIPMNTIEEQIASVNLNLSIANHTLSKEAFQIRVEIHEDDLIHVVSILSSAVVSIKDSTKEGIVVDIDTIAITNGKPLDEVYKTLDSTRLANKTKFFDCLTEKTVNFLEPVYE